VLTGGDCALIGRTPRESDVRRIADWLWERGVEEILATHALADLLPDAQAFTDVASGVLAISISRLHPSFVLWFRPEIVRSVAWGGDPRKPAEAAPAVTSAPPHCSRFAKYSPEARCRSAKRTGCFAASAMAACTEAGIIDAVRNV